MQRNKKSLVLLALATLSTFASASSCFYETKTTLCEETGLRCKPGLACAAAQAACIISGGCGDGIRSADEECDDGNVTAGDGCAADCKSDESCGNRIIDSAVGELCDDGGREPGDGCSDLCLLEQCGDRVVSEAQGEQCDTGPGDSIACDADCTFRVCGDGYVNELIEECEPPTPTSTPMDTPECDGDCTRPACGDRRTNPTYVPPNNAANEPEQCDAGGDTSACNGHNNLSGPRGGNCRTPACGDGYANPMFKPPGDDAQNEVCDEGGDTQNCNGANGIDGKGDCQPAKCGDGYLNPSHKTPRQSSNVEACDRGGNHAECNGNDADNDGVDDDVDNDSSGRGNCQSPTCGDGYINPAKFINGHREECDPGSSLPNKGCQIGTCNNCECV